MVPGFIPRLWNHVQDGYLYALWFAKDWGWPLNAGPTFTPVKLLLFARLGVKTRSGKDDFLFL